ncbi:unnamed protein product [Pleuronectes platessa]|uniref:Uncharacterized protein n=1 Tax=Pleuronectes platessa TaxID=8262 RepID=A0A9N7U4M2_PLEPL|nr:unnamed protein product [Pleuronectes platessa]
MRHRLFAFINGRLPSTHKSGTSKISIPCGGEVIQLISDTVPLGSASVLQGEVRAKRRGEKRQWEEYGISWRVASSRQTRTHCRYNAAVLRQSGVAVGLIETSPRPISTDGADVRRRPRQSAVTDRDTHSGEDQGSSVVLCLCRGCVGGVPSGSGGQVWALWSRSIAPQGCHQRPKPQNNEGEEKRPPLTSHHLHTRPGGPITTLQEEEPGSQGHRQIVSETKIR